jgi:hypothetical protein
MTARTDYLAYLTAQGYTPNRAILFEDGTGTPQEYYAASAETLNGTPSWISTAYGTAWETTGLSDRVMLDEGLALSDFESTTAQTVILVMRKTDTTARAGVAFGVADVSNDNQRCSAHVPWSDGMVKWDFGGTGGNNRLEYAWTKDTTIHAWAFRAGTLGSSIWLDGTKVATHSNVITRSHSTKGTHVGSVSNIAFGDLQEMYACIWIPFEVPDAILSLLTVDAVLVGTNPDIVQTSPLTTARVGEAYSNTLTSSGGEEPFAWSITAGALPSGLTLNASTGAITGTPPEDSEGMYTFTVTCTGADDQTDAVEFQLFVDSALCTLSNFGSLLRGLWANNSRVGPHFSDGKEVACIFKDYDSNKLLAQWSVDGGVTWTEVRTAAFTNTIDSFDSHHILDSDVIHVAVQEATTGRVSYSVFNLASGTWTTDNQTVTSSVTSFGGTATVSMAVLSGGDPIIAYYGTPESVLGTDRSRIVSKRKTSGSWAAEQAWGDVGQAQSNDLGRLVPTASNRAYLIHSVSPGYFVGSTPDFQLQILKSDGTLSAITVFHFSGLLGTVTSWFMGNYAVYEQDGTTYLAVPTWLGGGTQWYIFEDSDTPATYVATGSESAFLGTDEVVPYILMHDGTTLHSVDWQWGSLGSDTYLRYMSMTDPLTEEFTPDDGYQLSPTFGAIETLNENADAAVILRTCEDEDFVYVATVQRIGTVNLNTDTNKFEWVKVDDIATLSTTRPSIATWLTDLETQELEFCCSADPTPEAGLEYVEILRGSILEADWLKRDLRGSNAAVAIPQIFSMEIAAEKIYLSMLPPPNAVRGLEYIYVPRPTTLELPANNTDQEIDLPEDFIPFIKFGVMADLFSKSGEAHDPVRAAICQDLFELGVELGRYYVGGTNV